MEGEEGGGAVRKMGDCKRGGDAAVFVEENQVGDVSGEAGGGELGEDGVATVEAD